MPDAEPTRTLAAAESAATHNFTDAPALDAAEAPDRIGRFAVLGEIARGGMGIVYRTHDPHLDREVAVKLLAGTLAGRPDAARRFLDEARITGQLQHPSVPPVHETGALHDGRPYLVMKLIKGQTLDDRLKDLPDPAADRGSLLAVFEQVCQAVAYAHDRGVIHRDLKPANVMVGAFGEVQVMDWGLAKVLGESAPVDPAEAEGSNRTEIRSTRDSESYTQAGSLLGTPAYMPPEQAAGAVHLIDARADVFGLGAILCAILTGKPPYTASSGELVRIKAVQGRVGEAHERLDACGAEPELVALAKRCLAAEPGDRPADAGEVARAVAGLRAAADERARRAELDRVRTEGDLRAAEAQAAEQRKRRKVQAALGLTFTALVVLGGGFAWWTREQELGRREQAEREVNQAVQTAVARYSQARGADRDLALWAEARAAALQARERAAQAAAPVDVQNRIRDLLAEIEQSEKNRRLVATLLEVQAGMGDELAHDYNQNFARANTRYEQAFRDYGTDLFALTPEAGADLLRGLGGNRTIELAAALDDWAYVLRFARNRTRGSEAHLFQVTRRLDPDPLRNRIRDAITAGDRSTLLAIADELDPAAQPVQTVNLIPIYLYIFRGRNDNSDLIRYLRRVHPHHPGDFQINHNLAFYLLRDQHYEQSLPYCLAAIAVRPRSSVAWHDYRIALQGLGRTGEVIPVLRRICANSPGTVVCRHDLANALFQAGDRPGALAALKDAVAVAQAALPNAPDDAALLEQTRSVTVALARALHNDGDHDGALAVYREAVQIDPENTAALAELVNLLTARGDANEAAEFNRLLEKLRKVRSMDALCDQTIALLRAGQSDKAVALLPRIAEVRALQPRETVGLSHALARLGEALVDNGRPAEAEPILRDCLAIRVALTQDSWLSGYTRTYIGSSLAGQGKPGEAEVAVGSPGTELEFAL